LTLVSTGLDTFDGTYRGTKPEEVPTLSDADDRVIASVVFLLLNPNGSYGYGDKLVLFTLNCNVLEWKVTADGTDWSWTAE